MNPKKSPPDKYRYKHIEEDILVREREREYREKELRREKAEAEERVRMKMKVDLEVRRLLAVRAAERDGF